MKFYVRHFFPVICVAISSASKGLSDLTSLRSSQIMKLHRVCRNAKYVCGAETISRFKVTDDQVPWSIDFPTYDPPVFTMKNLSSKPWADPEIGSPGFQPMWNSLDGSVDRRSHTGAYGIVDSYPRNPLGRTGLRGRGRLGRWGPNHAADPVVTRWKRLTGGSVVNHSVSGLPVLQFVAIKRHDCGEWAIPGGMIDPGEVVSNTLRREFCEEAMNSLSLSESEKQDLESSVSNFFDSGKVIYKGYVDDPRNTDNAWMETVACNFHDETGGIVGRFPLNAGDDASQVRWTDFSSDIKLYANHIDFLKQVAVLLGAHH